MKRSVALDYIKAAGYHADRARFTRLYAENRISMPAALAAYRAGEKARANGVPCNCSDCRKQNPGRAFIVNPSQPAGRRAVEIGITDRALRYRANAAAPEGPKICGYCGSRHNVEVEHIDGREENGNPENLLYACRSCNTRKGAFYARQGRGRKTRQYNPGKATGARTLAQWLKAAASITGAVKAMTTAAAERMITATSPEKRAEYAAALATARKNPEAVPSFREYLDACDSHRRGAHDAGGAVIHRTPKAKRREYAARIAELKRQHGTAGRRAASDDDIPDWAR